MNADRKSFEEQVREFFATVGISNVAALDDMLTEHAPLVFDWIHSPASYGKSIDTAPGGDQFDAECAAAAEAISEYVHDYRKGQVA